MDNKIDLHIRENLRRTLSIETHGMTLDGATVVAFALRKDERHEIARTTGQEPSMNVDCLFEIPPGTYRIEVINEDEGTIVYPQDDTINRVKVHNVESDDQD